MPRRKRGRWMWSPPTLRGFKPFGVPAFDKEPVILLLEEYEAIKLADYEDLTQQDAAQKMGISRPTFTRIYDVARKKVAKAFVEGLPIIIHGGNVRFREKWYRCLDCNRVFRSTENNNEKINNKKINYEKNKINKNFNTIKTKNTKKGNEKIKCPFCESFNIIEIEELHRKHFNRGKWFNY